MKSNYKTTFTIMELQHIKYAKDVEALYCFIDILTTSNVKTQNYKNLDR